MDRFPGFPLSMTASNAEDKNPTSSTPARSERLDRLNNRNKTESHSHVLQSQKKEKGGGIEKGQGVADSSDIVRESVTSSQIGRQTTS